MQQKSISILLLVASTLTSAFVPATSSSSSSSSSSYPMKNSFSSTRIIASNPISSSRKPKSILPLGMMPAAKWTTTAIFRFRPFVTSSMIFAACNGIGWILSVLTKSHLHLDLLGTGAFAAASAMFVPFFQGNMFPKDRIQQSASMVFLWGTKLATFLLVRVLKTGHDARLDDLLLTVSGATSFWIFSLVWGIVVSLPHTLGTTSSAPGSIITTSCGTALYTVGLFLETLADIQKWRFKDANPGKFCNVGLWSLSQHPNWFGNLLLWSGIFLLNAPALVQTVDSSKGVLHRIWSARLMLVALLSPIFLFSLFSAQATGALTPTVELATKKYGSDPDYMKYITTVPLIFPSIKKMFFKG